MSETDPKEALFAELEARFHALSGEFERLDAERLAQVIHWRYAEHSVFELRADYFRRFNEKVGQPVEDEPYELYNYYAYGYDQHGRICYDAFYQTEDVPRSVTFYDEAADHSDFAEYFLVHHTEQYYLGMVGRLVRNGERPACYAEYGQDRQFFESYQFDERGRFERIAADYGPHVVEDVYEYVGDTLQRIVSRSAYSLAELPSAMEWRLYELPPEGETDELLSEVAHRDVRVAVIERLTQLDPAERPQMPVYCLELNYDAVADDGISLWLGESAQREAWERETDEHSYRSLLFHSYTTKRNEFHILRPSYEYERWLRTYRHDQRWNEIRQLMNRVAGDLNQQDWTGILDITDDFIVFARDYEALEDVHDEIRNCVPEDREQVLIAKGLLD